MSHKPIFVATHPRACSTAFERVFMTRRDALTCVHEPFGDAFYFGPERLSERYEKNEKERVKSGFSDSTYRMILDRMEKDSAEGKRLFIKDIIHYLVPPQGEPARIAPSLARLAKGVGTNGTTGVTSNGTANGTTNNTTNGTQNKTTNGTTNGTTKGAVNKAPFPYCTDAEPNNPTVIPEEVLKKFHFTFLIRHPRSSIPSYYRCTIPPLDQVTGFYDFKPCEAGYDELRRVFDYLRSAGHIGPEIAGQQGLSNKSQAANSTNEKVEICVVDADDLLDNPNGIIEAFCKTVGLDYHDEMLNWDNDEDHEHAKAAFEKWTGFHEDAIDSSSLKPRLHKKKVKSFEDEDAEWIEKYGVHGARVIREAVDANVADYEYLKQFALKP